MSSLTDFIAGAAKIWTSGVTYKQSQIVFDPTDNYQTYVRVTAAGSGATAPSADSTNYKPLGGRAIKSIQRGTIAIISATSATATITSVNTAKAILECQGGYGNLQSGGNTIPVLALTNATTVTATVQSTTSGGAGTIVGYQVIEYY